MTPFEFIITEEYENLRAHNVISKIIKNFSYVFLQKLFRTNRIKINNKKINSDYRVKKGDIIKIYSNVFPEQHLIKKSSYNEKMINQFKEMIIFENENFIAINKPINLAVQMGTRVQICVETFTKEYQSYKNCECCKLTHRIDKDTSGILLIAKNQKTTRKITELFRENKIKKTYLAVVDGKIKEGGIIENYINKFEEKMKISETGQIAITQYHPLIINDTSEEFKYYSLLELTPKTGRKHQLRVHCAESLHAPILGDKKYNKHILHDVLFLHAYKIQIEYFKIEIIAPIPKYFPSFTI